jgi:hypothetical protein
MRLAKGLKFIRLPEGTEWVRFADGSVRFFGKGSVYGSEQLLLFSGSRLKRGEIEMGHWIQARKGLSVVQLEIALLIFGVVALGVMLTYHFAALPR